MKKCLSLVTMFLLAVAFNACSGDEGNTCGAGTVEQNGQCVPQCADSEYWDGSACQTIPSCDDGTTFNAATGKCEADITQCAAGTELVNGQCVSKCSDTEYWNGTACTPIPECGEGTVFNEATGQCDPVIADCAPGTHEENGECIPDVICGGDTHPENGECVPNTLPDPDVTEADVLFTVPAEGDSVSLGGTIDTPIDEDGDGLVDGNWDQFQFAATAGTYLKIMSTSEGAALPAFAIMGFDEDQNVIYQRIGLNPNGLVTEREVYLPYDAVYVILVTDYNMMVSALFGSDTVPVGGPDFTYYVEVTNQGTPDVSAIDSLPATQTGDLNDGSLKFYDFSAAEGDLLRLVSHGQPLPDTASDLYPIVMAFGPDGEFIKEVDANPSTDASVLLMASADGDYLLVQDFALALGPARDFAFDLGQKTYIDCTVDDCSSGALEEGSDLIQRGPLAAGDYMVTGVYLPSGETGTLNVTLLDENLDEVMSSQATSDQNAALMYYADHDMLAYLHIEEASGVAIDNFTEDHALIHTPLLEAGNSYTDLAVTEMPDGTLPNAGVDHITGTAGQFLFFSGFSTTDPTKAWIEPNEQIYTPDLGYMGPGFDVTNSNYPSLEPLFVRIPSDGDFLHIVWDSGDSSNIVGGTYSTTVNAMQPVEVETPVLDTPTLLEAQTLDATNVVALYEFNAASDGMYEVSVTPTEGSYVHPRMMVLSIGDLLADWFGTYWLADPEVGLSLGAIAMDSTSENGQAATAVAISPYEGPLFILVGNSEPAGDTDTFDLQITLLPPPENDTCDMAEELDLSSGSIVINASTYGASNTIDSHSCTSGGHGPDLWYSFTLDADAIVTIETLDVGGISDTVLGLFNSCDGAEVACNDDGGSGLLSRIDSVGLTAGTYYIIVDAWNSGQAGDFSLSITVE